MFDLICVTNRRLCSDFPAQIERVATAKPAAVILREKDLSEAEYKALALDVKKICEKYSVPLILHSFYKAAAELNIRAVHLPLPLLKTMTDSEKSWFTVLGASCHSIDDALEAKHLGCTYITAGHIFATDCKRGVPTRGLDFLKEVCDSVDIPVYAIGGINPENSVLAKSAGASGVCVMSGFMRCDNTTEYVKSFGC